MLGEFIREENEMKPEDAADRETGVISHRLKHSERVVAIERVDNEYFYDRVEDGVGVVAEAPRPLSISRTRKLVGAPITVYNDWPDRLDNQSLFSWLFRSPRAEYRGFVEFVKGWSKSACAIVFYPPAGASDPKIIGTGSLINVNIVATARHNYNGLDLARIYVRFFDYSLEVDPVSRRSVIKEHYLDIPILRVHNAAEGLDAGYVTIAELEDERLFHRFARVLPKFDEAFTGSRLPSGHYAMFHFAYGRPMVSIGQIEISRFYSYRLDELIQIQAGPGASGAAIIYQGFGKTYSGGLSVYRVHDGWVDRRVIPFVAFRAPAVVPIDEIIAPYKYNPDFRAFYSSALTESGYEFLRWNLAAQGQRPNHPVSPAYNVLANHSNHHIIPIGDLLYLWDYCDHLDHGTLNQIRDRVNGEVAQRSREEITALRGDIRGNYRDEPQRFVAGQAEIKERLARFKERRRRELVSEVLNGLYGAIKRILIRLTPGNRNDKTWFAWSFWNLFKGWEKDYRDDDPAALSCPDFSEQVRPETLDPRLWSCIKDRREGLYRRIQELKTVTRNQVAEDNLHRSLVALDCVWSERGRRDQCIQCIHPYNASEWEPVGRRSGHDIYIVKPS